MDTETTETTTSGTETAPPSPADDASLAERIAGLERDLQQTRRTLRQAQTGMEIHRALAGAGAVDAEAVALVVAAALPPTEGAPDAAAVAGIVAELRRTRPALFKSPAPARGSAMYARVDRPRTRVEDAAERAARIGDRGSLLDYLRLKRAG